MGFLEWWGESMNPGPRGGIRVESRSQELPTRGVVWTCLIVSMAGMIGGFYLLFAYLVPPTLTSLGVTLIVLGVYLLLAHFVHPEADTSNLGWMAGMMDDPFRWSDDWNRSLLGLNLLLLPGRFLGRSFVNFALMIRADTAPTDLDPNDDEQSL